MDPLTPNKSDRRTKWWLVAIGGVLVVVAIIIFAPKDPVAYPDFTPAVIAGPSGTSVTSAPVSSVSPMASATSGVTS